MTQIAIYVVAFAICFAIFIFGAWLGFILGALDQHGDA